MERNEISVILGSQNVHFNEQDRIFGIMYRLYHERIDPMISRYEKSLQTDIKAVGAIKLNSLRIPLSTNAPTSDLAPFAVELLDVFKTVAGALT